MGRGHGIRAGGLALLVLTALSVVTCNLTEGRTGARGTVGYTIEPPQGWRDVTRTVEERTGVAFDIAYRGRVAPDRPHANLNVARSAAPDGASLETLIRAGRDEVDRLGRGAIEFTPPVAAEVDGDPALRYDFATNGNTVRQVGVRHGAEFYVVTLTAPDAAFRAGLVRLAGLLRSWRWD